MTNGEYISFWSDDASVALFILKRILEKLGKQVKDFNNFMEAKYNKPFNVVFDSNPPQIRTKLEVEAMAVSFERGEGHNYGGIHKYTLFRAKGQGCPIWYIVAVSSLHRKAKTNSC